MYFHLFLSFQTNITIFFKNGPIPAFFLFIFVFSTCYNLNSNLNWKKHRRYAWDSNLGWQDGRRERIHWAMAAPLNTTIFTTINVKKYPSRKRCWDSNPRSLERESPPITTKFGCIIISKNKFASAHLHHQDENDLILGSMCKHVHLKTHLNSRVMEYIEYSSNNTLHPFQNKHQIHRHIQSVNMLCAYEKI